MLSVECSTDTRSVLIDFGRWRVVEINLTLDKLQWLWTEMQKYRTLFSDLTRGSFENFYNLILLQDSFWLEVIDEGDEVIGIVYWTDMKQMIDTSVHVMFFDRKPAEKIPLCREIAKWFFINFPQYHRMTATLPHIYHATIRLAGHVGFRREGRKRQSQIMGGKYVDEITMGLLASESL